MQGTLWLGEPSRSSHQLSLVYGFDNLRFETSYWYSDLDLLELERLWGQEALERIYFHILLLEASKLCSLRPAVLDPGPGARFFTPALETMWRRILRGVWAQWRYENDLPHEEGPRLLTEPQSTAPTPLHLERDGGTLLLCGGGKDSLVAMELLAGLGEGYSSLAYSCSVYGTAGPQHRLIDGLLDHGSPRHRHRQWIFDSLVDAPVLELNSNPPEGSHGLLAAETPSSIFATLPLVLAHGYRHLVVAHERSANVGNLVWEATGEDVNHQWGKSLEAECLMEGYIREHLVAEAGYYSVLQPIHDVLIFSLLRRSPGAVPATHSCNRHKPWCGRCPKCAYVGLGYLAYLGPEPLFTLFGGNPLDFEENQLSYRQMLGLEEHTPFECIGQVDEARLAFELCRRQGISGRALEVYTSAFPRLDTAPILDRYLVVDREHHGIPSHLAPRLLDHLEEAAGEARQWITERLASP